MSLAWGLRGVGAVAGLCPCSLDFSVRFLLHRLGASFDCSWSLWTLLRRRAWPPPGTTHSWSSPSAMARACCLCCATWAASGRLRLLNRTLAAATAATAVTCLFTRPRTAQSRFEACAGVGLTATANSRSAVPQPQSAMSHNDYCLGDCCFGDCCHTCLRVLRPSRRWGTSTRRCIVPRHSSCSIHGAIQQE